MAYVLDTSFVIDLMRSDGDAVRKAKPTTFFIDLPDA